MKYHKPLPVKTSYITADGIPTSRAGTPAGGPMPVHGGGAVSGGGGGTATKQECLTPDGGIVRDAADCLKVDWDKALGNAKVCSTDVLNCNNP